MKKKKFKKKKQFEKFVATIWENPLLLGEALANSNVVLKYDLDEIVHGLLFALYGNFFDPTEEQCVLKIMDVIFLSKIKKKKNLQI